jgi:PIN domain nuclease of toxin-antitoxin system
VTVLDAFAVLALLKGEPAADDVRRLIRDGSCTITTVGVAEIIDHLVRIVGVSDEEAALDVAQLGFSEIEPLDSALALRAGMLRARHYHRRTRAISLADCVAAETARARGDALATSDPPLLDTCHDEGIAIVVLPDTSGAIWHR